jgi:hypothetical protein
VFPEFAYKPAPLLDFIVQRTVIGVSARYRGQVLPIAYRSRLFFMRVFGRQKTRPDPIRARDLTVRASSLDHVISALEQ